MTLSGPLRSGADRAITGPVTPDPEEVGARIAALLERRGLRQAELADAIGSRPQAIWRYVNGKALATAAVLDAIAESLGVSSRWLLYGDAGLPESFREFLRSSPLAKEATEDDLDLLRGLVCAPDQDLPVSLYEKILLDLRTELGTGRR